MTTNREAGQDWIRRFVQMIAKDNAAPDDVEDLYTILDLGMFMINSDSRSAREMAERRQHAVYARLRRLDRLSNR